MSYLHDVVTAFVDQVKAILPPGVPVSFAEAEEQVDQLLISPPQVIVHLHSLNTVKDQGEVGKSRQPNAFAITTTVVARGSVKPLPNGTDALSLVATLIEGLTPLTAGVKLATTGQCTPIEYGEGKCQDVLPGALQWELTWAFRRYE